MDLRELLAQIFADHVIFAQFGYIEPLRDEGNWPTV